MKHYVEMRFQSLLDETVPVDFTPAVLNILWGRITDNVSALIGNIKVHTRDGDVTRSCARFLFTTPAQVDATHLAVQASQKCLGCVVAAIAGGVMHIGYCGILIGTQTIDASDVRREALVAGV